MNADTSLKIESGADAFGAGSTTERSQIKSLRRRHIAFALGGLAGHNAHGAGWIRRK